MPTFWTGIKYKDDITGPPEPAIPTPDDLESMRKALEDDQDLYYDEKVTPPVFGSKLGMSLLQRLGRLEESHASLQRQVAELRPTLLCADLIREPILNMEAGLVTEASLKCERNRAAHGGSMLADKRIIDERFGTNPSQALLWATKAFPSLYGIEYAVAEQAAKNPDLVAVINLRANAKTMHGIRYPSGSLYGSQMLIEAWLKSLEKGEEFDIHQEAWWRIFISNRLSE